MWAKPTHLVGGWDQTHATRPDIRHERDATPSEAVAEQQIKQQHKQRQLFVHHSSLQILLKQASRSVSCLLLPIWMFLISRTLQCNYIWSVPESKQR